MILGIYFGIAYFTALVYCILLEFNGIREYAIDLADVGIIQPVKDKTSYELDEYYVLMVVGISLAALSAIGALFLIALVFDYLTIK